MKLIYSHLKTFLPDLDVKPQQLRDDLTMIGHFTNYYEEIDNEIIFDLDIKVNRGDCLGYLGLAKDLSIFYNIPLQVTNYQLQFTNYKLPITVNTDNVSRVMAVKISDLKNSSSPQWLSKFARLHGINSINTLVDITNYIMFMYGIPCHAFDTAKSGDNLIWEMNSKFEQFTSLDGSQLKIDNSILMINNPNKALSLSFWGGESCAIDNSTNETIVELAIYNPSVVRQNSRSLKVSTEAAIRLEKKLDLSLIPQAFTHLCQLITKLTGGNISSNLFDYYPTPITTPIIEFDPTFPSKISGIDIPEEFALDIVKKVGSRADINLPEDLAEEVIRFWGYNKIPTNKPLSFKEVPNITPKILYLIDQLKDQYVNTGYDEVITWPLVIKAQSSKTIKTQNSINDEYIYLRESLIPSLRLQLDQYQRFKLPHPKFFEIGKIYYQENGQYVEKYALGSYDGAEFKEIILDDQIIPDTYIPQPINNSAVELKSQIITLDANVVSTKSADELLKYYQSEISPDILWSIEISDQYGDKYTFRVCYYNCDDKTAKNAHLKAFNLFTSPSREVST